MKTVFMYAGQGSQRVSMGSDMYEMFPKYKETVDQFDNFENIKKLMAEGPIEELTITKNTQPAMAIFAAGVTEVLLENNIKPDASVGLSLGEYGALYVAGVLNAKDYVETVAYRGKVMQEAAEGLTCSMSAILGLSANQVKEVVEAYNGEGYVTVANYNCPGQYVICGDEDAVAACEESLKAAGAKRCVRLNVSGPFHTKFMAPAGEKLEEKLKSITLNKASIPVGLNATGDFYKDGDDLVALLKKQIQSSVYFENSIQKMINEGADTFVEIGPGKTLTGFVKKIAKEMDKEVTIYTIDTAENLKEVLEVLR